MDFPQIEISYTLTGPIVIARFNNETKNCTLINLPPIGTNSILLMVWQLALEGGCTNFEDIVINNRFLAEDAMKRLPSLAVFVTSKFNQFCCQEPLFGRDWAINGGAVDYAHSKVVLTSVDQNTGLNLLQIAGSNRNATVTSCK